MSPYRPPSRLPASYAPPPGYGPSYGPPPSAFNLTDFFRLLDARRGLIIRVALATILCAVALAMVQPTTYSSSAVVILDPRKNNVTETTSVLSPLAPDAATMQNQLQILTSRELATTVVDRLKLQDDPEFNPTLARPSLMQLVGQMFSLLHPKNWFGNDMPAPGTLGKDRIVDNFLGHISADAQGLSTAMNVTARSRWPWCSPPPIPVRLS